MYVRLRYTVQVGKFPVGGVMVWITRKKVKLSLQIVRDKEHEKKSGTLQLALSGKQNI